MKSSEFNVLIWTVLIEKKKNFKILSNPKFTLQTNIIIIKIIKVLQHLQLKTYLNTIKLMLRIECLWPCMYEVNLAKRLMLRQMKGWWYFYFMMAKSTLGYKLVSIKNKWLKIPENIRFCKRLWSEIKFRKNKWKNVKVI